MHSTNRMKNQRTNCSQFLPRRNSILRRYRWDLRTVSQSVNQIMMELNNTINAVDWNVVISASHHSVFATFVCPKFAMHTRFFQWCQKWDHVWTLWKTSASVCIGMFWLRVYNILYYCGNSGEPISCAGYYHNYRLEETSVVQQTILMYQKPSLFFAINDSELMYY